MLFCAYYSFCSVPSPSFPLGYVERIKLMVAKLQPLVHEVLPRVVLLAIRERLGRYPSRYQDSMVLDGHHVSGLFDRDLGRMRTHVDVRVASFNLRGERILMPDTVFG
jgi:hypothetical protein